MESPRILHLEDDPRDAQLVSLALSRKSLECDIHVVASRADFLSALDSREYSVILSDTGLPDFSGLAALEVIRQPWLETPFVFVSGNLGSEENIARLKLAGAADCVAKSNLDELAPALRRVLYKVSRPAPRQFDYARAMERLVTAVQELSLARDLDTIQAIV